MKCPWFLVLMGLTMLAMMGETREIGYRNSNETIPMKLERLAEISNRQKSDENCNENSDKVETTTPEFMPLPEQPVSAIVNPPNIQCPPGHRRSAAGTCTKAIFFN